LEKDSANGRGGLAGRAEATIPTWGDLTKREKTAGAVPAVWDEFAA